MKIAINGLGRIGRCVLRALAEYQDQYENLEIVTVNGPADIKQHVHLIKYDSVHGVFSDIDYRDDKLIIKGKEIPLLQERDIRNIDWRKYDVDIVFECTGKFNSRELAYKHIESGAKKVIVSAPCENADATIIYQVNHDILKTDHKVISIGSCTTNCLAPVAKVINDNLEIEKGFVTTIHSYTNDQNLVDSSHKDMRRARAAGLSMVPSSTGAAKSIGIVLPELSGKLDGSAMRVPTPNVSAIDLKCLVSKNTSVKELNELFTSASKTSMNKVLGVSDEKLVSIDFNHTIMSSVIDIHETKIVGSNFIRVLAWYDNEWAFAIRMLDVASLM